MFNWDFNGAWSWFRKPHKQPARKVRKDGEVDTDVSESSEGEMTEINENDWENTQTILADIIKQCKK